VLGLGSMGTSLSVEAEELRDAAGELEKLWDGFEDREESEVETEDLNCLLDPTDPPAQTHLSGCKRFAR
jgi:hypothetical protein